MRNNKPRGAQSGGAAAEEAPGQRPIPFDRVHVQERNPMIEEGGGIYHTVQGLVKGLKLLSALNRCMGGSATAAELSQTIGIHRSTVKRLLETLRVEGFVHLMEDGLTYSLTYRVMNLSDGFNSQADISVCARPILRKLTETIMWPATLMTRQGHRMLIRYSTNSFSPMAYRMGLVGDQLPLFTSSTGLAYLAFCPEEERLHLMAILRGRQPSAGFPPTSEQMVDRQIAGIRSRGFAVTDGHSFGRPDFGGVVAPVIVHERAFACVTLFFPVRAVSLGNASKRYAPAVIETAREISRAYIAQDMETQSEIASLAP